MTMLMFCEQAPLLLTIGAKDVDVPMGMVNDFYHDCLLHRGMPYSVPYSVRLPG
jgi:hypothetical protein